MLSTKHKYIEMTTAKQENGNNTKSKTQFNITTMLGVDVQD